MGVAGAANDGAADAGAVWLGIANPGDAEAVLVFTCVLPCVGATLAVWLLVWLFGWDRTVAAVAIIGSVGIAIGCDVALVAVVGVPNETAAGLLVVGKDGADFGSAARA